jgi:drug/metabolite transporter (DMT)-like permease
MSTPLMFAEAVPVALGARRPLSRRQWTAIGAGAIPLWAMWPALALRTAMVPPLEILTLMFACGSASFSLLHALAGEREAAAPRGLSAWIPALVYAGALAGGDLCFLLATHRLPAAQASLIAYLWPVLIALFGAAAGAFRLRARQLAGLALGFGGAVILLWDGHIALSAGGVALALLSGALWAAYCVFRLLWRAPTGNLLARGCALAMLLCALLHALLEPTVLPQVGALIAAAVSGTVALGLGNFIWDAGFRRGDGQLLAVMAYATPLCSALLLAALGVALLTWNLLLGALVIVSAGLLARTPATAAAPP